MFFPFPSTLLFRDFLGFSVKTFCIPIIFSLISGCSPSNIIKDEDNRYIGGGNNDKPIQVVISEKKDSKTYVHADGLPHAKNVTGGKIYGNYNKKGKVSDAVVTMESGHVNFVEGGYGEKEETGNNRVKVISGKLDGTMVDGCKYSVIGGYNKEGTAQGNSVEIVNGTFIGDIDGGVSKTGKSFGNKIVFNGGTIKGDIDGGYTKQGITEGNIVEFNGGTLNDGEICGGSGDEATVKSNQVIIRGENSLINGKVIGGSNDEGDVVGNKVAVLGGTFKNYIIGGTGEGGTVAGNSIYLSGNPNISDAQIIPGYSKSSAVSGNILQAEGLGFTAKNIVNADKIYLILPREVKKGSTVFTLTMDKGTDLGNPAISIKIDKEATPLSEGDEITIVSNKNGLKISGEALSKKICGTHDNLQYQFLLIKKDGNLIAKVERKGEKICTPDE